MLPKKTDKIFDRDIDITDDEIGGLPFDEVTRSYAEPMKKIEQPDKSILIDGSDLLGSNQPTDSSAISSAIPTLDDLGIRIATFGSNGKKKKKGKKGKKAKSQGIKWI